jgi:hypothetical protein
MSQAMDTLGICLEIKNQVCWSYPVLYGICVLIGGLIGWVLDRIKVKSEIAKLKNESIKLQSENTKLLSDYYKNKHESERNLTREYKEIDKIIDELIKGLSSGASDNVVVELRERLCDKLANDVMQMFSQLFDYVSCDYNFGLSQFQSVVIGEFDRYVEWFEIINNDKFISELSCSPLFVSDSYFLKFESFCEKNKAQAEYKMLVSCLNVIKSKITKA